MLFVSVTIYFIAVIRYLYLKSFRIKSGCLGNINSWRTIILVPEASSDSFSINQVGKIIWQDTTQDIRIIDRKTVVLDNNDDIPPYVGLAQKVEHVEAGKPYTVSFHVKEFGPSEEQAIVFSILNKEAVDQYSFSAFDMESGMLSQNIYTDTGAYTFSFTSPTEQDVILYIGHVSVSEGYAVIDDVQLSTYAEQQMLTETFDDSIAPWRNSALTEAENPPLQAGTIEWEADSQRLKITQGDFVMETDSVWLGAAARELPVQSYKQYRISLDVLNSLQNPIEITNIEDASLDIYDADEFALGGPLATEPIVKIPFSNYGTLQSGTFRARQGNIVALMHIISGKTPEQPDAGVFYIDNLRLELVENSITYTCDANTPNTIIGVGYRFGFNGQERETEINPSVTTAEYWEYDGRLGRRWNKDPKPNPSISVYATFENNPILYKDTDGDTLVMQGTLQQIEKMVVGRAMGTSSTMKYKTAYDKKTDTYTLTAYGIDKTYDNSGKYKEAIEDLNSILTSKMVIYEKFEKNTDEPDPAEGQGGSYFQPISRTIWHSENWLTDKWTNGGKSRYGYYDHNIKNSESYAGWLITHPFGDHTYCMQSVREVDFWEAQNHETVHAKRHVTYKTTYNRIYEENIAIDRVNQTYKKLGIPLKPREK